MLRTVHQPKSVDEENPYWISFSDIMSGLLVIFILAALALILELTNTRKQIDKAIEQLMKAEEVRRDLLKEVQEALRAKNILVIIDEDSSVIRLNEDVLAFGSDRIEIPQQKKYVLEQIGLVLHDAIIKGDRRSYIDTVFVEGHTDEQRSRRFSDLGGNWGLSTHRAISVWNFWKDTLPEDKQLTELDNYEKRKMFSVSGYGPTRPIEILQETDEQRQRNRRIDLRFTLKRFSSDDFAAVRAIAE